MTFRSATSIEVPRWRKYVPGPDPKRNKEDGEKHGRSTSQAPHIGRRYRARSLSSPGASARGSGWMSPSTVPCRGRALKASMMSPLGAEHDHEEVGVEVEGMEKENEIENEGLDEDGDFDEELEEWEEILECHHLAMEERKLWAGITDKDMTHPPPRKAPRISSSSSPSSVALNNPHNSTPNNQQGFITPLYPLPYDVFNSLCRAAADTVSEEQLDSQSASSVSARAKARKTVSSVLRAYSTISDLEGAVKRTVSVVRTAAINVRNTCPPGIRHETMANRRASTSNQFNSASNSKDAFSSFLTPPSPSMSKLPPPPMHPPSSASLDLPSIAAQKSVSKLASASNAGHVLGSSDLASGNVSASSLAALEAIPTKLLAFVDQCLTCVANMSMSCQKFNGALIEPSLNVLAECGFNVGSEQKDFKEVCNLLRDILNNQLREPEKKKKAKAPLHERFSEAFKKNIDSKVFPAFSNSTFNWKDYNFTGSDSCLLDFLKTLAAKADRQNHVVDARGQDATPMHLKPRRLDDEKTKSPKQERALSIVKMDMDNDFVGVPHAPSNDRTNGHMNGIDDSSSRSNSPSPPSKPPLPMPSRSSRIHSQRRLYRPRSPSPVDTFFQSYALPSSRFDRSRPVHGSFGVFESGHHLQSTRGGYTTHPSFSRPSGPLSSRTASSPSHSRSPTQSCSHSNSRSQSRSRPCSRSPSSPFSSPSSRSPSPSRSQSPSRSLSNSPRTFRQSERPRQPLSPLYYPSHILRPPSPVRSPPRYASHPSVLSNAIVTSRTRYADNLRSPRAAPRSNNSRHLSSDLERSGSLSRARRSRSNNHSSYRVVGSSLRLRDQSSRGIMQSSLHGTRRDVPSSSRFSSFNPYRRPYRPKETPVVELDD